MRFAYTIIYVDNVPATLDFYKSAFGLEIGFLHEGQDYGELVTGETKLAFSAKSLMRQMGKSPGDADPKSPVAEIAFETSDVPSAFDSALSAGASQVSKPEETPWGQTIAYVSDPDGTLIEICTPVGG